MKKLFFFFVVFLLSFSFVLAEGESCSVDEDCASNELCLDSVCTVYCAIGEAACSDGLDNDFDYGYGGGVDFTGSCDTDFDGDPDYNCVEEGFLTPGECAVQCVSSSGLNGNYLPGDPDCRSPYDYSEEDNPQCSDGHDNDGDGLVDYPEDSNCISPEIDSEAGGASSAPSLEVEEEGFFQRFFSWLFFWN